MEWHWGEFAVAVIAAVAGYVTRWLQRRKNGG